MAERKTEYKRVGGQGRWPSGLSFSLRRGLWSAPDHLLYVEKETCGETYRRFPYRNIQAILVKRTNTGAIATAVLGTLTAMALLWLLFMGVDPVSNVGQIIFPTTAAGILALALIVNIARGPTCATYVRTAVQTQQIWSVNRLRRARTVIENLRGTIEETQGGPFTEALVEKMRTEVARQEEEAAAVERQRAATGPAGPAHALKPYKGNAHRVLFGLLLADFYHNCLQFHFTHRSLHLVATVLGVGILVWLVTSLIKQFRTTMWTSVKAITWLTVPYLGVLAFLASLFPFFSGPLYLAGAGGSWGMYQDIYSTSPYDSWLRMTMVVVGILGSGGLGLSGLLLFNKFKRQKTPAPDLPATPTKTAPSQPAPEPAPESAGEPGREPDAAPGTTAEPETVE